MSQPNDEPADRPGPYLGPGGYGFGHPPGPAGVRPVLGPRPAQVTAASWISAVLGGLVGLVLVMLPTSAGPEIAETLTGSADGKTTVAVAALLGAAGYLVPAIYLRRRKAWARTMMIVVAALGVAGGVMTLPAGILGLGLHVTLLVFMLQQSTRAWFGSVR